MVSVLGLQARIKEWSGLIDRCGSILPANLSYYDLRHFRANRHLASIPVNHIANPRAVRDAAE